MSEAFTNEKPLLIKVVADKLGVSIKTLSRLIRDRELDAYKLRGRWVLHESDLKNYEEKQRARQKGKQP